MTATPLPPFPKPDIWSHVVTVWRDGVECQIDQGPRFTSDQMREYAALARADLETENANLRLELQSARDINLAVVNRQQAEIEAIIAPKVPTPTPKCPNKFKPDGTYSGCQLHNLHCAYPNCEK